MRRTRSLTGLLVSLAVLAVAGLALAACGGDDEVEVGGSTGTGAGAAGEERAATVEVSEGCREAWYDSGDARYRARDLPEGWQPGDQRQGTLRFESEGVAVFEASDGSGTATFSGGEGAAFTMDCPVWPEGSGAGG
jgi:hypothetical protein